MNSRPLQKALCERMAYNVDFTLTFFDACVNYSICKAESRQKMWSERLAVARENTPPGVRVIRDLWPRRPEHATQRSGRGAARKICCRQ